MPTIDVTDVTPAKRDEFWSKVRCLGERECWLWLGTTDGYGYGRMYLGGRVFEGAHRLAWLLANGSIPPGIHVLHVCDNPPCVNPRHLFLGTHQDNMDDRGIKGRTAHNAGAKNGMRLHPELASRGDRHWSRIHPENRARGSGHGRAVLTEEQVKEIRSLYSQRRNARALARQFGVSSTHVFRIVRRRAWGHVVDA